jgi:hypothetical protein
MLELTIGTEGWDEEAEKFVRIDPITLQFEHSLVSMSKWESVYMVPFLSGTSAKTPEQIFEYIKMMVVTPGVDPASLTIERFSQLDLNKIQKYIDSSESATTFGEMPVKKGSKETITSELVYYWLVAFNIPWEAERWHLNRLFALIRICNLKQSKPKKIPRHELAQRNREINEARKKALGTTG